MNIIMLGQIKILQKTIQIPQKIIIISKNQMQAKIFINVICLKMIKEMHTLIIEF